MPLVDAEGNDGPGPGGSRRAVDCPQPAAAVPAAGLQAIGGDRDGMPRRFFVLIGPRPTAMHG